MLGRRQAMLLMLASGVSGIVGCGDDITVQAPNSPTPLPTPTPAPAPKPDRVEFRVIGSHRNVLIRHVSSQDGTTQVTSDLPYTSSFTTLEPTMFLSLEANANSTFVTGSTPFLSIQILVNGTVLREASSNLFFASLLISLTYRRATATENGSFLIESVVGDTSGDSE